VIIFTACICSWLALTTEQFADLDPELPLSDIQTMQQVIGESVNNASFSATLVVMFAVLSLTLAAVGLYGVLSYLMTQRTGELGIRIGLGAQRDQVLRLMLFDGLRPAIFGLAFGLAASNGNPPDPGHALWNKTTRSRNLWRGLRHIAVGRSAGLCGSRVASIPFGPRSGFTDRIAWANS